jgi:hypothetical protein
MKRQFVGTGVKVPHPLIRRVVRYGSSRVICFTHLIPLDWRVVKVIPRRQSESILELTIEPVVREAPDELRGKVKVKAKVSV